MLFFLLSIFLFRYFGRNFKLIFAFAIFSLISSGCIPLSAYIGICVHSNHKSIVTMKTRKIPQDDHVRAQISDMQVLL